MDTFRTKEEIEELILDKPSIRTFYNCKFECKFRELLEVICEKQISYILNFNNCHFYFSETSTDEYEEYYIYGLNFSECTFYSSFYIANIKLEIIIQFDRCNFNNNSIEIFNITSNYETLFAIDNATNINNFNIEKITRAKSRINFGNDSLLKISFSNNEFNNVSISDIDNIDLDVSNSKIKNKLSIEGIEGTLNIYSDREDYCIKNIELGYIGKIDKLHFFTNTFDDFKIINSKIIHSDCLLSKNYHFENVEFSNDFLFKNELNDNDINAIIIKKCKFLSDFNLDYSEKGEVPLINKIVCTDTSFEKKVWIEGVNTNSLSFHNCKFLETAKIYDLKGTIKIADFSNSTIEGLFLFNGWSSKINLDEDSIINFSHVFLKSSGYIILRNLNFIDNQAESDNNASNNGVLLFDFANILGNIIFQSSNINLLIANKANFLGHLLIQDVSLKQINLENSSGNITFNPKDGFEIGKKTIANRDTARIIKKCKENDGDKIKSLEYKSLEHKLFNIELNKMYKSSENNNKTKKINIIQDKLLLSLNTLSNNNGTSWIRGVIFTLVSCFVFFSIYIMAKEGIGNVCIWTNKKYIGDALSYFWLFGGLDNLKDSNKDILITWQALIPYILGKIFIGYGIYQTISAFRKFGK